MRWARPIALLATCILLPNQLVHGGKSTSDHWAFQQIKSPSTPGMELGENSTSVIDFFISRTQIGKGLKAQPLAEPDILLRRLYLDLSGLPPLPQQRQQFLEDPSHASFERIVDQLLSSVDYAENWARHWMDIWRYSDWYGLGKQLRTSQKHLWHWRDWIIDSLNEDKGYDRMIQEMLAGDEIAPGNPKVVRATGFLARNYYLFNRNTWLDSTIEHTTKAFLGLTLNCAKCHDHKYDPLSQKDYYKMRAIFEPHQVRLDPLPGQTNLEIDGLPRVFDDHLDAPTYLFKRGNDKSPDIDQLITPDIPGIFGKLDIQSIPLPITAYAPGTRKYVIRDLLKESEEKFQKALSTLESSSDSSQRIPNELKLQAARTNHEALKARIEADRRKWIDRETEDRCTEAISLATRKQWLAELADAELGLVQARRQLDILAEDQKATSKDLKKVEKTIEERQTTIEKLKSRGPDEDYTSIKASRKALESPADKHSDYPPVYPNLSTGRRRALAYAITNPENPLAARVAVNHVWLRLMGSAFVTDTTDFGLRSSPPLQQDVLDFLASDLMQNDWSLKRLIKQIVTSNAYRRSSARRTIDDIRNRKDPENRYHWHAVVKRMNAQMIRDSILHLSGTLDPQLGGPSIPASDKIKTKRKSLYFLHSRDDQHRFLAIFDNADILNCYRREESIAPQQSLAMMNDQFMQESAVRLAEMLNPQSDLPVFVSNAFKRVLGRRPTEKETQTCITALNIIRTSENSDAQELRIRSHLILALFNHNDFITIR
ncbi:MAG TPA: DUF1553 domain-containing protein [Verrucomicrobiales bacterium]|nr:DUF1553 domain-containing protein [Verrucomicrobiales bacterium]HIL71315.1 DUF1553 domain-containing protein [Verrucomicrobiota bacterium]